MEEFHRGSSSVTRLEIHVSYKVKYCHKVFDISEVKQRCQEIFFEVAALHRITIKEIGFDGDHVQRDIRKENTSRISRNKTQVFLGIWVVGRTSLWRLSRT